jgi:hypothetical protein
MGAFSIKREGVDRQAIDTAIDVLVRADRPLVMFPRGLHLTHYRPAEDALGWNCCYGPHRGEEACPR